jgi:hypothetical protein
VAEVYDVIERAAEFLARKPVAATLKCGQSPVTCITRWPQIDPCLEYDVANRFEIAKMLVLCLRKHPSTRLQVFGKCDEIRVMLARAFTTALIDAHVCIAPYLSAMKVLEANAASVGDVLSVFRDARAATFRLREQVANPRSPQPRFEISDALWACIVVRLCGPVNQHSSDTRMLADLLTADGRRNFRERFIPWNLAHDDFSHQNEPRVDVRRLFRLSQKTEDAVAFLASDDGAIQTRFIELALLGLTLPEIDAEFWPRDWESECDVPYRTLKEARAGSSRQYARAPFDVGVFDERVPAQGSGSSSASSDSTASSSAAMSSAGDEFGSEEEDDGVDLDVTAIETTYLSRENVKGRALARLRSIVLTWNGRPSLRPDEKINVKGADIGFETWLEALATGPRIESILAEPTHFGLWSRVRFEVQDAGLVELSKVAAIVLALPASEAESERVVGRLRRILGNHRFRFKSKALLARLRLITAQNV